MLMVRNFACSFMVFAAMSAASAFAAGTLPAGYTEVEYIQGNGSNARIVTDYTPNPSTDKIELEVEWPANTLGVNQAIWCARGSDTTVNTWTMFMLGKDGDNKLRFDYKSTVSALLTPAVSVGTKYTVTVDRNAATWTGGDGYSHPVVSGFTAAGGPAMLFASYINGTGNNLGNYGKQKLYSFKVWRSGELIHYFVPCKDSGGAATMVDICDDPATLTKSGTFTAGNEGHHYDDALFSNFAILPIPEQFGPLSDMPKPGFTITNYVTGAFWVFAEGGVASGATQFDIAYSFVGSVGTVTATGKAGSEYEGKTVKRNYKLTHDLIVNGDFESGAWAPGWTASGNYAKIETSSSAYQPNASTTFISGAYCAILQKQNVASQVFTNDSQYCAELSWKCKQRGGYSDIPYEVMLDGERIFYEYFPTGTSEVHYRTVENIVLQPGEHTLTFHTITTADRTLFLDNVSLEVVSKTYLEILPIPNQSCATGPCRPEFVVSNLVEGQVWRVGGSSVSADFDVEYTNNAVLGMATVTAIGKGDLAGEVVSRTFAITEDENVSTADTAAYRLDVGDNVVYVFTNAASAQTITARKGLFLAKALLVGGGGAGGINFGGGGGGGGVVALDDVNFSLAPGESLRFTVGVGGKPSTSTAAGNGRYGGDTSIYIGDKFYRAKGGGGGGNANQIYGQSGGSGGGGTKGGTGGAGTAGQGYAGATAGANSRSGGGGGAGHAGYTYTDSPKRAGNGGEGITNDITGVWVCYGGGGGGGGSANSWDYFDPGYGGAGGGGNGGKDVDGDAGVDGLGGGGGGGGYIGDRKGGNGGTGTLIFSFKVSGFDIDPIGTQYLEPGGCYPEPVVRDGGTLLVKDVDYEVSYTDNTKAGSATVTITGKNGYVGKSAILSFMIASRFFAKPSVSSGGDGRSWASAMSVTGALAAAAAETGYREVWIEEGTVSQPAIAVDNDDLLIIRGGFAGTETTLDERQPGALTVFDGENTATALLSISDVTDANTVVERIKFCRAMNNGFVKTGGGSLRVYDCVVEANGRSVSAVWGRGMNVQSSGYGFLVVSNCVFAGNRCTSSDTQYGGFGLYVKSFREAVVDSSLFVTNGYDIRRAETPSGGGWDYCGMYSKGSAALVVDTPITVRNSRFAGNCCPLRKSLSVDQAGSGGALTLIGASGGSRVENCVFVGNIDRRSQGMEGDNGSGALAVYLNSASAKVAVDNCTFAYNITAGSQSAGGITVLRGSADVENTIFWKNRRYHLTILGYGTDVQVQADGAASISHSLVSSLDGTALAGVNLTVDDDTVFAADPRLVTTTADFESQLTNTEKTVYYDYTRASRYEDLASIDAHLLSSAGYVVNGGAAGPETILTSPAIDSGDPDADYANEPVPNGSRLNLGAYGNTIEASLTPVGQPEATVEVAFPDGEARPEAVVTMGLESGNGYLATVHVICSINGMIIAEETFARVANGDVLKLRSPSYQPSGVNFDVAVEITAPGAELRNYQESKAVSGTYPPYYGKGGGSEVIHVRTGADGMQDGSNWEHAYPDLRAAFASMPDASKTEVWLAVTNDYMQTAVALAYPLTVRGGFAGVEDSPAERPEGSMTWLDGSSAYKTMDFDVPSGALLTVERIHFAHSSGPGIRKTGAGDLLVRDCYFTDRKQSDWSLQGGGIYATGGTASITNCQFVNLIDYSVNALSYSFYGGDGIYLSSCTAAYVDDCLFATNGIQFYRNKGAQARHTGSAAYISATPTVFRNCRFASNGAAIMEAADSAGTIHFKGASGGSKLINCALVGNSDFEGSQSSADPTAGGTIVCNMSTTNATLDIENCTIAYNLTQGRWTGAGINVCKGTVNLKNSIVYGNVRNRNSDTVNAGADIEVKSNATLTVSYTLVTGLESNYVHAVEGGTINIGEGVITDDPLLTTTTNDFQSLFSTKDSGGLPYLPQSARAACAAIDVHPRSNTGYMLNGVLIRDPENVESPTIDAGDPKSDYSREPEISGVGGNGHRVNLGVYGNTPEAALTNRGFHIFLR